MRFSGLRQIVCCVLIVVFPFSAFAADTGAAMLYAKGTAWINGAAVPRSSALFPGDLVQTRADSIVNINLPGSSILVLADSLMKYDSQSLALEHGSVTVSTSRKVNARVGEVTITPVADAMTEYQVTDVDGTVQIAARRGDLAITDDSGNTATLPQGQQTTRQESKRSKGGAQPAANGGWLDSKWAIGIGSGIIVGLLSWSLAQGGTPLSPDSPASTGR
jgi:hypothetical protein